MPQTGAVIFKPGRGHKVLLLVMSQEHLRLDTRGQNGGKNTNNQAREMVLCTPARSLACVAETKRKEK